MKKRQRLDFNQLAKAVAEKAEQEHIMIKPQTTSKVQVSSIAHNDEDSETLLMAFVNAQSIEEQSKK